MKPRDHRLLDNISNHSSLSHIKSRAFDECKATEIQTSEEKPLITPQLELEIHYYTLKIRRDRICHLTGADEHMTACMTRNSMIDRRS